MPENLANPQRLQAGKIVLLLLALWTSDSRFGSCLHAASPQGEILGKEGTVDFTRSKTNWAPALVGQRLIVEDRMRTMALSRAMVQLAELGRLRVNELTTLEVLPPRTNGGKATLDLKAGALYFFSRDKPREFLIQTPHAVAASRGTEFLVTIEPGGRVVFTVFDGEVDLSNPQGSLVLAAGEQGAAQAGQAPVKLAALQAVNLVQWWLYYPGVLDADEVPLTVAEQAVLAVSLDNYRRGDLLAAIDNYPAGRVPQSDAEKVFYAAMLLAVGQVDKAEAQLTTSLTQPTLVNALREVIAAVNLRPFSSTNPPELASEWMARSYWQQSQFDLRGALASARAAAKTSTNFGFAWERVAELEFSFGRTDAAVEALDRALQLSPRNAQAWALRGFLGAAHNRLKEATNAFQRAIDLDGALGNGWLGRGLVRIRMGDGKGGRVDLQTAAAMEPNRSVLRSYLGKAFDHLGELTNAMKELHLAKELDLADPTPWLYSALLLRQQLRFNEAIEELEKSVVLNTNRAVYRSRLLLDEDRAVRSSSLATIYQSAGMNEVSVREAARAVAADYANPSAHLFLSDSYNALRDPTDFNLRYDTAWLSELLLANLLAPVGAGVLSRNVTQHEYSRLFEADRVGLSIDTEGRTDGQVRTLTSQFGTYKQMSYSLDLDYKHFDGVRHNNDLSRIEWFSQVKYQLTPQDSLFFFAEYFDYESGDNFQYVNPNDARRSFRFTESQKPNLLAAYHREWSPGVHTLFLAGRLEDDQRYGDKNLSEGVLIFDANGDLITLQEQLLNADYRGQFEIFTSELNQIIQGERFNIVLGGRFQAGSFKTTDRLTLPANSGVSNLFNNPPASDSVRDHFERLAGYGYYTLRILDDLYATAGLAYDQITYPVNHRFVPISDGSITRNRLSPKAALVWSPLSELTFRGIYSRAVGGVSFDESFRLEPSQLAGFNQSFRSVIPESVAGSVSGAPYEVVAGAMDVKLKTHTYLGLEGQVLNSDVHRRVGYFSYDASTPIPLALPTSTPQRLDYEERSFAATINQLVSDAWSFGVQYRFTESELQTVYPNIPTSIFRGLNRTEHSDLQQVTLHVLYNHASGFFARAETQWYHQENSSSAATLASEDFYQQNIFVGYRFRRQRGEISLGVLNLNDKDYRLNPLTLYSELPRERTFVARLKINL